MKYIKRAAVIFMVAFTAMFVVGTPALAQDVSTEVATTNVSLITVAAPIVTAIVSVLIPLINGYFTTRRTPGWVKALALIVLNAVSALITNGMLADGSSAFSSTTVWTAFVGCLISAFMYFNIYKSLNLTSSDSLDKNGQVVIGKLASVGRT